MSDTVKISPEEFPENIFSLIGKQWMLVSAAKENGAFNTMTASWGGAGVLWGKNVCFVFVRPTRYTYGFTEESELVTLSFFGEEYRSALKICGTESGRNSDKIAKCGLHASVSDGLVRFNEARVTVSGRKLYSSFLTPECFYDKSLLSLYNNDFHKCYVYEITDISVVS